MEIKSTAAVMEKTRPREEKGDKRAVHEISAARARIEQGREGKGREGKKNAPKNPL